VFRSTRLLTSSPRCRNLQRPESRRVSSGEFDSYSIARRPPTSTWTYIYERRGEGVRSCRRTRYTVHEYQQLARLHACTIAPCPPRLVRRVRQYPTAVEPAGGAVGLLARSVSRGMARAPVAVRGVEVHARSVDSCVVLATSSSGVVSCPLRFIHQILDRGIGQMRHQRRQPVRGARDPSVGIEDPLGLRVGIACSNCTHAVHTRRPVAVRFRAAGTDETQMLWPA
jgi:hypothetical protein